MADHFTPIRRSRIYASLNFFFLNSVLNTLAIFFAVLIALPLVSHATEVTSCFVPEYHGGPSCTEQVTEAIGAAHKTILVQAYAFTSAPIAKALVEAHRRGVTVRVILDKSNVKQGYSSATFLQHMGVPPLIDSFHAIAHNKVIVIDDHLVITGSFNFSSAAESRNAENLVFIDNGAVAADFTRNWSEHAQHSQLMGAVEIRSSTNRGTALSSPAAIEGNRRSHIYEWPGCPYYGKVSLQNQVDFPDRASAELAGYRPAHNCH
jgi:phosphatidylserine/phosphatidylglycerophosphate/cardiolipin synthase-like enzyme